MPSPQVRRADLIVVMCDGQIVQMGTHDDLMKEDCDSGDHNTRTTYKSLVRRQVFVE